MLGGVIDENTVPVCVYTCAFVAVAYVVSVMLQDQNTAVQLIRALEAENAATKTETQLVKTDIKALRAQCATLREENQALMAGQYTLEEDITASKHMTIKATKTLFVVTGAVFQLLSHLAVDMAARNESLTPGDRVSDILDTMDALIRLGYEPENDVSAALGVLKQTHVEI